jgi:hypothetical protein
MAQVGKKVASKASKLLKTSTSKKVKSVAAAALRCRRKGK